MKLSIIIPVHNEAQTIEVILGAVLTVNLNGWTREIIVVNDGSTDNTKNILTKFTEPEILVLQHASNFGKGQAIKTALGKVTGDYVIIQDADLEYQPLDIPKLLNIVFQLTTPIAVFGNRGTKSYPERGFHYVVGAKLLTFVHNVLFGQSLHDLYTGYKLIPANLIKSFNLESMGFEFEAEVAAKLAKAGCRIVEIPINYIPRSKKQGKHISFSDAIKGLWSIVKYRVK
jgi:glycosyltransferase involved in cell wall biosynthesis